MGRRAAPFEHKVHREAALKRRRREAAPVAKLVIDSQLLVTKKRIAKGEYACPNASELRIKAKELVKQNTVTALPLEPGDTVAFVPPGPRRARDLAVGEFLSFADGKSTFAAIDRGFRRRRRRLDQIFVVPVKDCFVR